MDAQAYKRMIARLIDELAEHHGYFIYLLRVVPDRTPQAYTLLQDSF
jgi:hypothetical protein